MFMDSLAVQPPQANEVLFVVGMGLSTVFIGLICIIILCKMIGFFCRSKTDSEKVQNQAKPVANDTQKPIQNRQEIIAAVSAVCAEELGTDISAIRILSFKKL